MIAWQTLGQYEYEYEYDKSGYTGWYRCVGGKMADRRWPEWNNKTGETRYC